MVNIISHWEWDGDYRKQQICKNNTALHTFVFFFFLGEFSFILNNDSTNPFFSSRVTRSPPYQSHRTHRLSVRFISALQIEKVITAARHIGNYIIVPLIIG